MKAHRYFQSHGVGIWSLVFAFAALGCGDGVLESSQGPTGSGDTPGNTPGTVGVDPVTGAELPDEVGITKTDPCGTALQSFESELYGPVFSRCIGCHNEFGLARQVGIGYRLKFHGEANFAEHNVSVLESYAPIDENVDGSSVPLLVAKATGLISHVGGQVLVPGSAEALLLESFTDKLRNPPACAEPTPDLAAQALQNLVLATPLQTYARARFVLTGKLATPEELDQLPDTEDMLSSQIDALLATDDFLVRAQEMFADWLRTDAYSSLVRGSELLGMLRDFPQREYYLRACSDEVTNNCCDLTTETCCLATGTEEECAAGGTLAIDAIAREPMELVKHIVANDLPLTELATANYGFVNPYSAMIYGLPEAQRQALFDADASNDASEFEPFVLTPTAENDLRADATGAYPHAGVLTMPSTLVRYPSSDSNQQRTRGARVVLERMLAIPVMKLAEFSTASLPPGADLELATQEYPACTVCHAAIDPIAAHFRSFGETGQFRPGGEGLGRRFQAEEQTYLPDPSFLSVTVPEDLGRDAVSWLGDQVIGHDRFALGMIMPVLADLVGAEIVAPPNDVLAEEYREKYLAFLIQQVEIQRLRRELVGSYGLRLKPLVKSILMGAFFRAVEAPPDLDPVVARGLSLAGVGLGTLLTPEQLARKLESATGLTYRSGLEPGGADMFRSFNEYRLMFGGTDWDATPERYRIPNAMSVRIALRMSNEVACLAVPQDLSIIDPASRRLLVNSSYTDTPDANEAAIRADISRLHRLLLNEHLPAGDAELEATYQLWVASYQAAQTDTGSSGNSGRGSFGRSDVSCNATASYTPDATPYPTTTNQVIDESPTVTAWVAVVSYLLADGHFFLQ